MNAHSPAVFREYGRKSTDGNGTDLPPDRAIKQLGEQLSGVLAQVKTFGEEAQKAIKEGRDLSEESKRNADEALSKAGELKGRFDDLEQKLLRKGNDEPVELKTMGQLVVENEEFKSGSMGASSRKSLRVKMDRKDITSANSTVGAGRSPGTSLVSADRQPGIIAPPDRQLTIRDLLMPGETDSNMIEYVQETGFTNNAGMVAEGALKPKSDITFDMANAPVRVIAHIFKASRQILDDAPQLRTYIDARGRTGLKLKEEQQLLMGDGTGQNLLGLMAQATDYLQPTGVVLPSVVTAIDRIRLAILQVYLAEYPASGIVLNPIDWASIEMIKDGEGRYLIANPQGQIQKRLWNLPVVDTQAMPVGDFMTGAFNMAAQIFDRMDVEVLLSTENEDDFVKNMVTIRVEERVGLAVYRPEAFVAGTLAGA